MIPTPLDSGFRRNDVTGGILCGLAAPAPPLVPPRRGGREMVRFAKGEGNHKGCPYGMCPLCPPY